MNPDKERCLANIYSLAKKKGLKIGDLETSCGVSIGYLARLRQDKKQNLPGSEFLFRAAALLEVSVDRLVNFDYRVAADTDDYLFSFISQLIEDTIIDKLAWRIDTSCFPSPAVSDHRVPYPDHPLLSLDPVLLEQGKSKETYLSPFHPPARNLVPKGAWSADISEDAYVLLVRVGREQADPAVADPWEELELYLCGEKNKICSALCHTTWQSPGPLDHSLADLCEMVSMIFQQSALDQFAISAIDYYMNVRSGQ